ncbi:hypothetical protein F4779DRAFT_641473 [Xylariaceae sp. FL0662B]|nr:hypothetical protein F4779DRAFT_641473 [Xylariaceae sp. FL0662B]
MATLQKSKSSNFSTAEMTSSDGTSLSASPSSKSEQGGGARLDTRLGNLSLNASPTNKYESSNPRTSVHTGQAALGFTQKPRGTALNNEPHFQVGNAPGDDVFLSPSRAQESYLSAPNAAGASVSSMQGAVPAMQPVRVLRTRNSDIGNRSQVAGVDAQAFYPATACVFVANLPEHVRDARLEAEVTRAFSDFGIVFVKIRRDQKNMPFAFCQFTNNDDAKSAMTQGKGTMIEGRPCRTEMVKANRTFVIYSSQGRDVSVDEARQQLAAFGPMSKCEALHSQIQEAMKIQGGVLVEFTTFDPARDVIAAFRHHPQYRVVAYDLKKSMQSPKVDPDEAWLLRYEVDRRSIFVGGLPVDVSNIEELLKELVADIGDVQKVQVIQKEARNGHGSPVAFAFIEFARPDMAELAVKRLNGEILCGCPIRVERKASKDTQSARRVRSQVVIPKESQSPVNGKQSITTVENAADPLTPLRPAGTEALPSTSSSGSVPLAAAPIHPQPYGYMPYGGQNYPSPTYTSPYNAQAGAGNFPATPQTTPGVMSPYAPTAYYPSAYSWMTPYLQDPNLASMAYYHAYSASPMAGAPQNTGQVDSTGNPAESRLEQNASSNWVNNTPTRSNAGKGESSAGEGREPV